MHGITIQYIALDELNSDGLRGLSSESCTDWKSGLELPICMCQNYTAYCSTFHFAKQSAGGRSSDQSFF